MQKPKITEIQVRMDCNGCVHKIKKALHGISGIHDLYIDFPSQKITIIGWAEPEKIVKAIKKTRKSAIICSHTEPPDPEPQAAEPAQEGGASSPPEGGSTAQESTDPPPTEAPPAGTAPPAETCKDQPTKENEEKPSQPESGGTKASQPAQSAGPKDVEEVRIVYHYPPDYGYRYGPGQIGHHDYGGQWNTYPSGSGGRREPTPPVYVTHSYNTYKPSPYVTEYEYVRPPPRYTDYSMPGSNMDGYHNGGRGNEHVNFPRQTYYSRPQHYMEGYHSASNGNGNGNVNFQSPPPPPPPPRYTYYSRPDPYIDDYGYGNNSSGSVSSVFSDENPNACMIV